MGKINDYMNKYNRIQQNNERNTNVKKDKLNITGIKDSFTSLSYKLGEQINLKIKKCATIAAIATTLAVSGVAITNNVSSHNSNNAYENQILQKDDVMEKANSMLKNYVVNNSKENLDNIKVNYVFDEGGCTSIQVTSGKTRFYTYSSGSLENILNNKKINEMLTKMIQIERNDNPSQKDLASLLVLLDELENSSFKLQGKYIVAIDEKDSDIER